MIGDEGDGVEEMLGQMGQTRGNGGQVRDEI